MVSFKSIWKCLHKIDISIAAPEAVEDVQVAKFPFAESLAPRPPYIPLAIPEDIAPRLIRLHGSPIVWWVGQFLKYLFRPQARLAADIQESTQRLGFKNPIVGYVTEFFFFFLCWRNLVCNEPIAVAPLCKILKHSWVCHRIFLHICCKNCVCKEHIAIVPLNISEKYIFWITKKGLLTYNLFPTLYIRK